VGYKVQVALSRVYVMPVSPARAFHPMVICGVITPSASVREISLTVKAGAVMALTSGLRIAVFGADFLPPTSA
jgi:hypothetical protein